MLYKWCRQLFGSSQIIRNKFFKTLNTDDLNYFKSFLKDSQVQQENLEKYNIDWVKQFQGKSSAVLLPNNVDQLSQILKYCYKNNLAVVPQGGNTGLVGGSVPVFDEIIISLSKMNKIINFDQNTNVLTLESGVILEEANNYLQQFQCEIPWDLGAKGSCQIGGNVSTHAGGKYYVKYGPLRQNILGMEVVRANGQILDMLSEVRKDNTGIDLKQLFIGSEGSLGIISKVNVFCHNIQKFRNLYLIKCSSYETILNIYIQSRKLLGKNLAAIEWMDGWSYDCSITAFPTKLKNPFQQLNDKQKDFYILIEINSNSNIDQIEENFYEEISQVNGFQECVKAQNDQQFQELWQIREWMGNSVQENAEYQFIYDVSLSISKMNDLTLILRDRLKQFNCFVIGYGHIGDSNLHLNVGLKNIKDQEIILKHIEPFLYEYLQKEKGSISAEHGLGIVKNNFLQYQKTDFQINTMKNMKQIFDDKNILNPYKMFPN